MTDLHPAIAHLTLPQKATLLSGADFWTTRASPDGSVPAIMLSDGPHGVRRQAEGQDHLGINASRPATAFPTASATACSWDRDLLWEIGDALGVEAREHGVDVLLGPGVNIKRSPLCGRNFEYFSEDPLLAGELGTEWVRGLQSRGVGASVKHFAANNQEADRMSVSVEVDERTLREIYLRAFERIVRRAAPATLMASYNRINGTFAAESRWLLTEVLRDEWGFEGAVVSDWGAVGDPVASVRAGLDLEMPGTGTISTELIVRAVEGGTLAEEVVDIAASRVLRLAESTAVRTGVPASFDRDAHHRLARTAAERSAVLIKNDGMLPLRDTKDEGSLLIVGELARTPRYQGAGSSHIQPTRLDDALAAVTARAGARPVAFEPGYVLDGADNDRLRDAAVEAARSAADVVVFLGLPDAAESESFDRDTLQLPSVQLALLERLTTVSSRVIVVLAHGGAVVVTPWADRVSSILDMGLGGQAVGSATASLLFGDANPSGKTTETVPHRLEDTPAFLNFPGDGRTVRYGERVYVGYRYYDAVDREVAVPFGHGLSYTVFGYGGAEVEMGEGRLTVAVDVSNLGQRDGAEIVQVYAEPPHGGLDRPRRELVGFSRVVVAAGQTVRAEVVVELGDLDAYDPSVQAWVRPGGTWTFWAAASSRDLRSRVQVSLQSTEPAPTLTLDANVGAWLDSSAGAEALAELHTSIGLAGPGDMDAHTLPLVRPLPLRNVLRMNLLAHGVELDDPRVMRMLSHVNDSQAARPERAIS